jgi:cobalamin biosynthesis Mg chelatase CobN
MFSAIKDLLAKAVAQFKSDHSKFVSAYKNKMYGPEIKKSWATIATAYSSILNATNPTQQKVFSDAYRKLVSKHKTMVATAEAQMQAEIASQTTTINEVGTIITNVTGVPSGSTNSGGATSTTATTKSSGTNNTPNTSNIPAYTRGPQINPATVQVNQAGMDPKIIIGALVLGLLFMFKRKRK